jgi:hypothetical protein
LPLTLSFLFSGCQSGTNHQPSEARKSAAPQQQSAEVSHREFNDAARFIAGMAPEPGSQLAEMSATPQWMKFAASFDKSWAKLDKSRLAVMRSWADSELHAGASDKTTLFYPFSGPDFLYAVTFFPHAESYVLGGLEPVGNVPDFQQMTPETQEQFFVTVARSLDSLLSFSFFKTDDMKVDVKKDLEGTLPILMLFLARTGNQVENVTPVDIGEDGALVAGSKTSKAVDILFKNPEGSKRHLYYFSANVQNDYIKKSTFGKYMGKLDGVTTYLKSASYLMHKDYFSTIRGAILEHSTMVVQDDSGIPYRFFKPEKWDVTLYGVYSSPIAMFKDHREADLAGAYKEAKGVKPLPFGIGYNWRPGQSNLLVARRKVS